MKNSKVQEKNCRYINGALLNLGIDALKLIVFGYTDILFEFVSQLMMKKGAL